MNKYRILASNTLDGLAEQINEVAEQGYKLSNFEQNGTADNDWQGIAIMELSEPPKEAGSSEANLNIADVMNRNYTYYDMKKCFNKGAERGTFVGAVICGRKIDDAPKLFDEFISSEYGS